MSAAMLDEEIIVVPDSIGAEDDYSHWICNKCWPNYIPGRFVQGVCGALAPDCAIGDISDPHGCPKCDEILYCPRCGEPVKDGEFPELYL